jgi:hypothetical protein
MEAMRLGPPRFLTPGEVALTGKLAPLGVDRAWEYWRRRAGADDL